jgi:hypothetical protein
LVKVTEITVNLDAETGAATIELRGAAVAEARFRLRDAATEKFLTRRGWSKTPSFLPGEAITVADFTALVLDGDLARRVPPGAKLILEQPTSNIFANLSWPGQAAATADENEDGEATKEETPPSDEPAMDSAEVDAEPSPSQDEAASPDAVVADAQAPVEPDTPVAAADDVVANAEPESLEPSIRDEATTPFRTEPQVDVKPATERSWGRSDKAETTEDDESEDNGRPWGKLAAAALAFMLLGSVLTYFWQSSAYENELRTAMRAVEAQRDEQKAAFDKQLAAIDANADKTSSDAVTAANARIATLTSQATDLSKERDEAQAEVSEQQAAVKILQERLSTAQGEIESLKAAADADASEQSAVFNERITALNKELDAARNELETSRVQLAERERAANAADDALKTARDEIAALKQSAAEQSEAQGEEIEGRIRALSEQLDKAVQDLASRDATLRDVQSKLSVANVQIEALKQVAGKATSADLERSTLADRITELTTQIDAADKALAAKDQELKKATTSLEAANALLASNETELKKLQGAAAPASDSSNAEDAGALAQMKQERDLYAQELSQMTESLKVLKAERDRLAEAAGDPTRQEANLAAGIVTSESRAIWGATAIDQAGAIYSLQNQTNEKIANDNAVAMCRGKSNGRCEPLRSYSNSCFSLARIEGEGPRNDNFGFSINKDWKSAERSALQQCEELGGNCTVRFTACSPDALSKPAANQ